MSLCFRSIIAGIAFAALCSFWAPIAAHAESFSCSTSDYNYSFSDTLSRQTIEFHGSITPTSGRSCLAKLYAKLEQGKDILLVLHESRGGWKDDFLEFSKRLRTACPMGSYKIETAAPDLCASACVHLFMVGDRRIVGPRTQFGFHREWFGIDRVINIPVQSPQEFVDEFSRLGANREWLERNLNELLSDQENCTWVSARDLIEGGFADSSNSLYPPIPYLKSDEVKLFRRNPAPENPSQVTDSTIPLRLFDDSYYFANGKVMRKAVSGN